MLCFEKEEGANPYHIEMSQIIILILKLDNDKPSNYTVHLLIYNFMY